MWFIFQNIFIVCLIKLIFVNGRPEGYRYSNFYGPVSGPATEIEIEPEVYNHKGSFDYFVSPFLKLFKF